MDSDAYDKAWTVFLLLGSVIPWGGLGLYFLITGMTNIGGFNALTVGTILEVQSKGGSYWLCTAIVSLELESAFNVTVDVPCLSYGSNSGSQLDICYRRAAPTEARMQLPSPQSSYSGQILNNIPYDLGCSSLTYREAVWRLWIGSALLLAIFVLTFVGCRLCRPPERDVVAENHTADVETGQAELDPFSDEPR